MQRVMIEVLEKSWNFQSSIHVGNTVRDYFKDTVTPHFFNAAIGCIGLIKTAFSQARHPAPPSSLYGLTLPPTPPPRKNPQQSTPPVKLRMCPA